MGGLTSGFTLQSVPEWHYNPVVAVVRPIRPESSEPHGLHVEAMDNLRFIRNAMENAGSFTAVPGQGGILMGATALFAAFAAHLSKSPKAWLGVWLGEAVLALMIGLVFSHRKADKNSTPLLSKPFRRFVLAVAPSVFAGALLTFVLYHEGFRQFTFANPVRLWAGTNPKFFEGTCVEDAVAKELIRL